MANIEGLDKVVKKLEALANDKNWDGTGVVVGYTQSYAVNVHEDLDASHRAGKTAKFLEGPAREYNTQISELINRTYKATKDIKKALMVGGLFLQRKSQMIVPIDTGALRASAFTALDKDAASAAAQAHAGSEAIRRSRKK